MGDFTSKVKLLQNLKFPNFDIGCRIKQFGSFPCNLVHSCCLIGFRTICCNLGSPRLFKGDGAHMYSTGFTYCTLGGYSNAFWCHCLELLKLPNFSTGSNHFKLILSLAKFDKYANILNIVYKCVCTGVAIQEQQAKMLDGCNRKITRVSLENQALE